MKKPTNIKHAPADATHWAPEQDEWVEAYYRKDRDGLWYCVSDYWASDVDQRPHGFAAQAWRKKPIYPLSKMRPLDQLILIDTFVEEVTKPEPIEPRQAELDKADAERYRFLKTFTHFDTALEAYCGMDMLDPNPESNGDYIDDTIDKVMKERYK